MQFDISRAILYNGLYGTRFRTRKGHCASHRREGIFLVPTLGAYRKMIERGEKGEVPDFMYRKTLQVVERHAESIRVGLAAGVKIAAGTDSGADRYPGAIAWCSN